MSFWTAVVIVAIIWAIVTLYTRRHDREMGVTRDEDGNPVFKPQDDAMTKQEIEDLRERIKVLERIATDGNSLDAQETRRISAEIDALREKQSD